MTIQLHPSTQQKTQEQARRTHPDVLNICQLHTIQKISHEILTNIRYCCELLQSIPMTDQKRYSQILHLTQTYTKNNRIYQQASTNFWQQAILYWTNHAKERTTLLNALYPVTLESRIQFKTDLKNMLRNITPPSRRLTIEPPASKFHDIQEESIEAVLSEMAEETEVTTPSPLKRQKSTQSLGPLLFQ